MSDRELEYLIACHREHIRLTPAHRRRLEAAILPSERRVHWKAIAVTALLTAACAVVAVMVSGRRSIFAEPAVFEPNQASRERAEPGLHGTVEPAPRVGSSSSSPAPREVESAGDSTPRVEVLRSPADVARPSPSPRQSVPRVRSTTKPESPTASALASASDDAAWLIAAERTVATDPLASLRMLARHEAAYPNSVFALERTALKAIAACASGEAQAREQAAAFVTRHPRLPYSARIHRTCRLKPTND